MKFWDIVCMFIVMTVGSLVAKLIASKWEERKAKKDGNYNQRTR